jgi:hypothetical protein
VVQYFLVLSLVSLVRSTNNSIDSCIMSHKLILAIVIVFLSSKFIVIRLSSELKDNWDFFIAELIMKVEMRVLSSYFFICCIFQAVAECRCLPPFWRQSMRRWNHTPQMSRLLINKITWTLLLID